MSVINKLKKIAIGAIVLIVVANVVNAPSTFSEGIKYGEHQTMEYYNELMERNSEIRQRRALKIESLPEDVRDVVENNPLDKILMGFNKIDVGVSTIVFPISKIICGNESMIRVGIKKGRMSLVVGVATGYVVGVYKHRKYVHELYKL